MTALYFLKRYVAFQWRVAKRLLQAFSPTICLLLHKSWCLEKVASSATLRSGCALSHFKTSHLRMRAETGQQGTGDPFSLRVQCDLPDFHELLRTLARVHFCGVNMALRVDGNVVNPMKIASLSA